MFRAVGGYEKGFSLLELSVAVGVSAIVATAGIVATTVFIGDVDGKRDVYVANANDSIVQAREASLMLGETDSNTPSLTYSHSIDAPTVAEVWGTSTFNGESGAHIVIQNPSNELITLIQYGGVTVADITFNIIGEFSSVPVEAVGYCSPTATDCDFRLFSNPAVYVKIPDFVVEANNLEYAAVSSIVFQ